MDSFSILRSSGIIGIILFLILFSVMAFLLIRANKRKFNKRDKIFKKYQQSLSRLRNNPNDMVLKERTITLGRAYSNLTLNKNLTRTYDEMELMRDINAACANATTAPVVRPNQSIEHRLKQLEDLRFKQMISESEYASRRRQILNEI